MNSFLIEQDYPALFRTEVREQLTRKSSITLEQAEIYAQSEMESYLKKRFNVAAIFPAVTLYNNSLTYQEGQHVYFDDNGTTLVKAASQTTVGNAPTNTTYWNDDQRNPHVVRLGIEIVAFLLYKNANALQTPDHVLTSYDDAVSWLKMVAANKISPDLPLLDEDGKSGLFIGGSQPQQSHTW